MQYYTYQFDDELRVVEDESGYSEVGVTKRVKAPSESLRNHVKAVKEFRDAMEFSMGDFVEETNRQEGEIAVQMAHGEFFLKDFKNNQWDSNPMFDRLRLLYISQIDSLKRERRQIRREKIKQGMAFMKELLDAKKELSPFSSLF